MPLLDSAHMTRLMLVLLLTVWSVGASAQVPTLTNSDVTHLVAMRVSEATVIAVIREASATQFDVSQQAVRELTVLGVSPAIVTAMSTPKTRIITPGPPAGAQTLAGAAAEAARIQHQWDLSPNVGSASTAPPPIVTPPPVESSTAKTEVKTEAYWRARVAPLHQHLAANIAEAGHLRRRVNELTDEVNSMGTLNARRGGVEAERQRLITEFEAVTRSIAADTRTLEAIEEEGRRAGALPGWFRD